MTIRQVVCGIVGVMLLMVVAVPRVRAQGPSPDDPVLELMLRMPPRMRVGQLMLVSFPGVSPDERSEIAALIREYGIGGVVLRPGNGNFGDVPVLPSTLVSMTNRLQSLAHRGPPDVLPPAETEAISPTLPSVPLLIAVDSEIEGVPITAFISDTTPLPTAMALGATWDTSLAEEAGQVMGRELAALGVNFFLGPGLDVLYMPSPGAPYDLGVRTFGGDPFWVGEMGKAYIRGIHQGSEGRVMVAPRHFPGLGSADRSLEEEVPTVQKSLEQLKQIELAPFFAVSGAPPGSSSEIADALLVTHIRYRGLQGNIRFTTRPISLDAQALKLVMSQEEIAPWREAGGILVADDLSLKSIQRFYDPRGRSFNARRVVQEAVLAGNDLLILDRFAANGSWEDHFANIRNTLDFLAANYETDTTLQAVVDDAVYRILKLKLRLYPDFAERVYASLGGVREQLGASVGGNVRVAKDAVTLIFPFSEDVLPVTPQEGESIVIFTQEYAVRVGEAQQPLPLLSRDAVAGALLRFYGPEGTGVVQRESVTWFTFDDLYVALTGESLQSSLTVTETTTISNSVTSALEGARWVIFAVVGSVPGEADIGVLKQFLSQRVGLLDARIVVLSFGPPYELDSTEISKLDLYYGLYSTGNAFVEAGVRALFRDIPPLGASPVSIPALNYDLTVQMMPDPQQVLTLYLVDEAGQEVTTTLRAAIGDVINLRTGVILDRNGHPVPDGTPVQFVLAYPQEGIEQTVVAETHKGVGEASVVLDRDGQLNITVVAEPAMASVRLELTIREDQLTEVTVVPPTPTPTSTPTLTPTSTPTPTPTPTLIPTVTPSLPQSIRLPLPDGRLLLRWGMGSAWLAFLVSFAVAVGRGVRLQYALRMGLWSAIGGLAGYVVMMVVVRWGVPGWLYRMAGYEFLAGGVALLVGLLVFLLRLWVERTEAQVNSPPYRYY